jgi:hypothetical protein
MDLKETDYVHEVCIELTQDCIQCLAVVNMIVNLQVP